jgi:hypothetical protein
MKKKKKKKIKDIKKINEKKNEDKFYTPKKRKFDIGNIYKEKGKKL